MASTVPLNTPLNLGYELLTHTLQNIYVTLGPTLLVLIYVPHWEDHHRAPEKKSCKNAVIFYHLMCKGADIWNMYIVEFLRCF